MSDPSVPEVRRPEPTPRWSDRWRSSLQLRLETLRHRAMLRRTKTAQTEQVEGDDASLMQPFIAERGGFFTALIAVGAALVALGSLWAWQTWSQRSSDPIDDLIPILAAAETVPDASETSGTPVAQAPAIAHSVAAGQEPIVATPPSTETPTMIVHVSGAVLVPGIVRLDVGARVFEAVDAAGGSTAIADLDRVNLAAALNDGDRIHLPEQGQDDVPAVVQPQPAVSQGSDGPEPELSLVDINSATAQQLQDLPGVGPSLAQAIITTRDERGPFLAVEELLDVPGIGEAKLAAIADRAIAVPLR